MMTTQSKDGITPLDKHTLTQPDLQTNAKETVCAHSEAIRVSTGRSCTSQLVYASKITCFGKT